MRLCGLRICSAFDPAVESSLPASDATGTSEARPDDIDWKGHAKESGLILYLPAVER